MVPGRDVRLTVWLVVSLSALMVGAGCDASDDATLSPLDGEPSPILGGSAPALAPQVATTPLTPVDVTPPGASEPGETGDEAGAPIEPPDLGDPAPGETGVDPGDEPEPDGADEPDLSIDQCLEGPNKTNKPQSNIFYGTQLPQHVPLSAGQIMAVGSFGSCSGSLIADQWVLSASHCTLGTGDWFCMGEQAWNPNKCLKLSEVYTHPSADLTIAKLTHPAQVVLPAVEPITLNTFPLNSQWLGRLAEAAGYGQQENGYSGEREFTAEPIVAVYDGALTIDGQGQHGVCFGDSGGPLMIIADDGTVRVAGTLSEGDGSCVGQDHFTRVDSYLSWIESKMGPIQMPGPQPCGSHLATGTCDADGEWATWCGPDDVLQVDKCEGQTTCSWDVGVEGWRCVGVDADPCGGLTTWGACGTDNVLSWCGEGGLLERDCGACDETCLPDEQIGWVCKATTCGDLTWFGECDGDVVSWCDRDGETESYNCGKQDKTCGWVDLEMGHYCVDKGCGGVDYYGQCKGGVVEWCEDGKLESLDCAGQGLSCGWVDDSTGFYCEQ